MSFPRFALAAAVVCLLGVGAASAKPLTPERVRQICQPDFHKACPTAQPGHGALKQCATAHFRSFAPPCQKALKALRSELERTEASAGAKP